MVSVRVIFFKAFLLFKFSLLYFGGVFNKTIIPLALVGYEMIIHHLISTRACGIIVNYERIDELLLLATVVKNKNFAELSTSRASTKHLKLFVHTLKRCTPTWTMKYLAQGYPYLGSH